MPMPMLTLTSSVPFKSGILHPPKVTHPFPHLAIYHAATAATNPATTIARTPPSTLLAPLFLVALADAALPVAVPLALPLALELPPLGPCAPAPAL